jgi:hypothetical protein
MGKGHFYGEQLAWLQARCQEYVQLELGQAKSDWARGVADAFMKDFDVPKPDDPKSAATYRNDVSKKYFLLVLYFIWMVDYPAMVLQPCWEGR